MTIRSYCGIGLILFTILGVADFLLTYFLIQTTGGEAYEANPVAAAWLSHYGWSGLAGFKAASMLVVVITVVVLVRRRPAFGVGVITFACLSLLWVTAYSSRLLAESRELNEEIALAESDPINRARVDIPPHRYKQLPPIPWGGWSLPERPAASEPPSPANSLPPQSSAADDCSGADPTRRGAEPCPADFSWY